MKSSHEGGKSPLLQSVVVSPGFKKYAYVHFQSRLRYLTSKEIYCFKQTLQTITPNFFYEQDDLTVVSPFGLYRPLLRRTTWLKYHNSSKV